MKTKLFISLILSIVLMSTVTWTMGQSMNVDTITPNKHYYICGNSITISSSCPAEDSHWMGQSWINGVNTITITTLNNPTNGMWSFTCVNPPDKTWYIHFVNQLTIPWTSATTNQCGDLHAQSGVNQPGTTYLWSTGATTESININQPGTYAVTVTSVANGCGSVSDAIDVLWSEPIPSLIGGGSYCAGVDTLQGNPSYTHQYANYNWSTGQSGPTANQIPLYATGTYSVTVTNANGCQMSANTSLVFKLPVSIQMCFVTFDTITWKNRIVWYVDPTQTDVDSVRVEVKNQLGQWISIGTVLYTDGSLIHMGANPQQDFNEYRVISIGHCGEGNYSQIHRNIWLSTFSNELQWQNYYGTFVPPYYVVFALMNTGANIPIDTVPSCSGAGCLNHSAIIANPNILKYFIAFQHTCSSNKSTGWVRSNYWDLLSGISSVKETTPSIYPNPTTGIINIAGMDGKCHIDVYNFSGQTMMQTENTNGIDLGTFSSGIYLIKIVTKNGVYTEKVTKQ